MICALEVPFQLTDYKDEWNWATSDVKSTLQEKGEEIPTQGTSVVEWARSCGAWL